MSHLTVKLGAITKRVYLHKSNDPEDLSRILESTFKTRERIVGVTDQYGKFYQLSFVNSNLSFLRGHTLSLVTVKDNDENMSFASDNGEQQKAQLPEEQLFQQAHGFLGFIHDLPFFEELLLEQKKLIIVVCADTDKSKMHLPYNFYVYKSSKSSVIIYFDRRKIGELYIDNWKKLEQKIDSIIKNFQEESEPQRAPPELPRSEPEYPSEKNFQHQNQTPTEEIKNTFLQNLYKLRAEETISELQFYKLKSKLLENPQDFMRKYQMGTRQGFRKRKSIDELRDEIVRSKEQKSRYQTIISEFHEGTRQNQQNVKNQIPIIVRKYNNVIEKISTSYPLTLQQEQAINLILELELKGLISENEAREYKAHILQEQPEIFGLFNEYFEDIIDQIELAKKLKNKKRIDRKTLEDKNKSQQLVRMIIKYAKRNSFELLRNMAIEGNPLIIKCYEKFEQDKDAHAFSANLEKIANYTRAKLRLEEGLHFQNFDSV